MADSLRWLPLLLELAWLLPLGSFVLIVFFGPLMGKGGRGAGWLATAAIMCSFVLSIAAATVWLSEHPLVHSSARDGSEHDCGASADEHCPAVAHKRAVPAAIFVERYVLAQFDQLRLSVAYWIDALTVAMFCMVTLVASCIHVYSTGYMHEELHEVTDQQVRTADGTALRRPGRYCRFFQYLSLFCFSMLGLVLAGNLAMVFAFWELVGICSYLLIGFYFERRSASLAANKAFIVNRVGDFGMLVGLMAAWSGFGTLALGDTTDAQGRLVQRGIFSQVRPAEADYRLTVPDGMVRMAAAEEISAMVANSHARRPAGEQGQFVEQHKATVDQWQSAEQQSAAAARWQSSEQPKAAAAQRWSVERRQPAAEAQVADRLPWWRSQGYGYWLLVIAGLGLFCGCVGKSAQFPLMVWLPDAMEGPTPVSALIHAATMVAAGVYLVARLYPMFAPEVLLVIACIGCLTLFIAATIAITATDIKRVLAYSTVSQLGYMMFALGVGGWLAGLFHLFTHAFFKALLFLCSGSVIHACGTNDMTQMGGLRRKMPWTAYTMLVGCLAICGAGVPLVVGLSGYYSKDAILAQALSFRAANPAWGGIVVVAFLGAGITAFYMFRMWLMTFAGQPRDKHIYQHAHESPPVMVGPLVVLAILAVIAGWPVPGTALSLESLLEQARPAGAAAGLDQGVLVAGLVIPDEHLSHENPVFHTSAALTAFAVSLLGVLLAAVFYGLPWLDPQVIRRAFAPIYSLLVNKWWLDEIYHYMLVAPTLRLSQLAAWLDRRAIDWLADGLARATALVAQLDDRFDRLVVDRAIDHAADWTYAFGLRLRRVQTGNIRQYLMVLAAGTVALFLLVSWFWR